MVNNERSKMKDKLSFEDFNKQINDLKRHNKSLYNKQLLFSSALNSISEIIIKEEKPEDLLENVNRVLGETLLVDRALIYYIAYENNQVVAMCEWLKSDNPHATATKDIYPLDLFKLSYKYFINTQQHIESYNDQVNEFFVKEGSGKILHEYMNIKSLLWYPFDFDENSFYLFALNQVSEKRQWTLDEIAFVGSVAKQVSLVLMKIKLYEERKKIEQNERNLKILNADKDRFISILAHDLKSPFNSLLGFSELLLKNLHKYDMSKIETQINIIYKTSRQTYELLEQLLLWANSQSGKFVVELCSFSFVDACNDVLKSQINQANEKNIRIKIYDAEKITLTADIEMFKVVMRNLISNAIKFTHHNGRIDVSAKRYNPNEALIAISDNGQGIEERMLSRLWDLSENTSTPGTNNEKGTGLGLKICKELIEKQGGRIWAESQIGMGSNFNFTLPFKE